MSLYQLVALDESIKAIDITLEFKARKASDPVKRFLAFFPR